MMVHKPVNHISRIFCYSKYMLVHLRCSISPCVPQSHASCFPSPNGSNLPNTSIASAASFLITCLCS